MLSNKARYALRALVWLGTHPEGGPATIAEIADATAAPRKFLEAILLDMRRHGLVLSSRGRTGGYRLAREAEAISFADVIRAVDGPLALAPCVSRTAYGPCETCPDVETCALRPALAAGREAVAAVLEQWTLAGSRES